MYIKMVGDNAKYQGKLERIGAHLIKVSGLIQHTSGFRLYLDNDTMVGDYSNFVYSYDDPNLGEGIYMYSDNNMNYKEESQRPTKEEEERQKIKDVIEKTVSGDINTLTKQVLNINETLLPMYEVLMSIQEMLQQSAEEEQTSKDNETPNEETVNEEQSDVNTEEETETP